MSEKTPETLIAIGTAAGATLTKILGTLMRRRNQEADKLRAEWRKELGSLKAEVQELRREVDTWREKYYVSREETILLRAECKSLKAELDEIQASMASGPRSG